jgi:hypothetical protein
MSGDGDPLALTAEEREALIGLLRRTLDEARYPFSLAVDAAADAEADAGDRQHARDHAWANPAGFHAHPLFVGTMGE